MSPAECTPVGFVVTMTALFTAFVIFSAWLLFGPAIAEATSPHARFERLKREEQAAILARAKQFMASGMTYEHAVGQAARERELESRAALRSILHAEAVMGGDGES